MNSVSQLVTNACPEWLTSLLPFHIGAEPDTPQTARTATQRKTLRKRETPKRATRATRATTRQRTKTKRTKRATPQADTPTQELATQGGGKNRATIVQSKRK